MLPNKIHGKGCGKDGKRHELPKDRAADRNQEGDEGDGGRKQEDFLFENESQNKCHERENDPDDRQNER